MINLNSFDILVDAQHGFRPGCSCETQLINTVEHLARSVNDRNQTDLLILDFSKAFDKVAHKRLLLKLEYYGIRGSVLAWIKAWLIRRTQQVAVEGEFSEKSCVRSGVPQGTVLGPLCFLLFVNDIASKIKSFADDTLLYGVVHNSDDAISLLSDLYKLVQWAKLWQIAFKHSEFYVLPVCRTKCPFIHPNTMPGHTPTGCRPLPLPRRFSVRGPTHGSHTSWTLQTKPIRHLALSRRTCIIAHRRLRIRPTRDQRWNMVVLPVGSVWNIPEIVARTGPAQGSTHRNKNLHEGGGMRNQRPTATILANSRKKKTSSWTDTDVQMCYQPGRYWYLLLCTTSVFPKNQSISSTEIYSTTAFLGHVQIQLLAENYHWLE